MADENKKKKVVLISDHPMICSGVGTQANYLIRGLLETGQYSFFCMGAAIVHAENRLIRVDPEKYGDDYRIAPVNFPSDEGQKQTIKNQMRQVLASEKPDAVVIFTDPRFFMWLFEMEDEVRSVCPILYWHVWDNDPTPTYNRPFYDSVDYISALSLKTYGLLQDMGYPADRFSYIPHALPPDVFFPLPDEQVDEFRRTKLGEPGKRPFILSWTNRNARRKMTGDVVEAFAKFADRVGHQNVALLMHTDPRDPEGQDIIALAKLFGVEADLIISDKRVPSEQMNMFYNAVDCTLNISSNEGFGLPTLEGLLAGAPMVVHMTGGLQFQVGDWWKDLKSFRNQEALTALSKRAWQARAGNWWGAPVFPAARSCTGSQQLPYIYDDRVNRDDVVDALVKVYKMGRPARRALALKGREWALKNFDLKKTVSAWDAAISGRVEAQRAAGRPTYKTATL